MWEGIHCSCKPNSCVYIIMYHHMYVSIVFQKLIIFMFTLCHMLGWLTRAINQTISYFCKNDLKPCQLLINEPESKILLHCITPQQWDFNVFCSNNEYKSWIHYYVWRFEHQRMSGQVWGDLNWWTLRLYQQLFNWATPLNLKSSNLVEQVQDVIQTLHIFYDLLYITSF